MTITVTLKHDAFGKAGGNNNSVSVGYWGDGTDAYERAVTQRGADAPTALGPFPKMSVKVDPTELSTHWDGTVQYGTRQGDQPKEEADPTFTMDIGTATTHITQSLETVNKYVPSGRTAANRKQVIGGKADGSVDGVDKLIAQASWTETHYLPKSKVNRAYFLTLYNLVARMNAASFREFARGEVLYIGGTLTKRRSAPDWECQFKFLPLPNVTGLSVGDITGIAKLGHDYLWVYYEGEKEETGTPVMVPLPKEVLVERLYTFGDYNAMKLPDPF